MESGSIVESWLMSNLFSCCRRYYMSGLLANRLEDNRRQSFILLMNTKQICNKSKWLKNIGLQTPNNISLSTFIHSNTVVKRYARYYNLDMGIIVIIAQLNVLTIEEWAVGPIKAVSGEWCMVTHQRMTGQSLSWGAHSHQIQSPLTQTYVTHFISTWHHTGQGNGQGFQLDCLIRSMKLCPWHF